MKGRLSGRAWIAVSFVVTEKRAKGYGKIVTSVRKVSLRLSSEIKCEFQRPFVYFSCSIACVQRILFVVEFGDMTGSTRLSTPLVLRVLDWRDGHTDLFGE